MHLDAIFDTELTRCLQCRYPIVQTAMGWVSDANLVSATTLAGGFGFLAGATIPEDKLEAEIQKIIEITGDSNFGLNFHMFQPNAMQCVEFAIQYKLKAVSYGRGPDRDTIARLKAANVLCIPTVGALKHALKAIELGADMITIQGSEGGGHTGEVPTSILLNQVLANVDVPVIAAGGFSNGRGLASALASGAVGIAMGTRFMMTSDSPTPAPTLTEYVNVNDPAHIKVSLAVDGMRHRMISNPFIQKFEKQSGLLRLITALKSAWIWKTATNMSLGHICKLLWQGLKEDPTAVSQLVMAANQPILLQHAMVDGRPNDGILPSGQVAATIENLPSVEMLLTDIMQEATSLFDFIFKKTQVSNMASDTKK